MKYVYILTSGRMPHKILSGTFSDSMIQFISIYINKWQIVIQEASQLRYTSKNGGECNDNQNQLVVGRFAGEPGWSDGRVQGLVTADCQGKQPREPAVRRADIRRMTGGYPPSGPRVPEAWLNSCRSVFQR